MREPWPLPRWPDVPTRYLLCRDDRAFPADWLRGVVRAPGLDPDEIDGGHCAYLSRPRELAERLAAYRADLAALDFYDRSCARTTSAFARPPRSGPATGCWTSAAAPARRRSRPPGVASHVLGVDVSEQMLERARQRATGAENVEFVLGDAQSHPFEPASFDLAISRCGLMFFADPDAAFANIRRALRPGGRLVGLIWQRYEDNEWATALRPRRSRSRSAIPRRRARGSSARASATSRFEDVHEPVFSGDDVEAALGLGGAVRRSRSRRSARAARRPRHRCAASSLDSRAWIVSATT